MSRRSTKDVVTIDKRSRQEGRSRRHIGELLCEREGLNFGLLNNSPNPIVVIDRDSSIRYANPALAKATGFSADELIGTKAPYPWWTEEMVQTGELDEAEHGCLKKREAIFRRRNGERFWVEITSTRVGSNGEFKYYLSSWVDITKRKRAQEEMRAECGTARSFVSAIAVADLEGNLVYADPSFVKMWGYDNEEEVLGKHLIEFWQMGEQAAAMVGAILEKGKWQGELVASRKDAATFDVKVSASTLADGNGKAMCMIISFIDVTGNRRLAEGSRRGNERLRITRRHLSDRVKGLNCLYGITRLMVEKSDIPLQELFGEVVRLIPSAWQYPQIAAARINLSGAEFKADNFKATQWGQSADILVKEHRVGVVEVCYAERPPDADEGPFSTDEKALIEAIAEALGGAIQRRRAEEAVQGSRWLFEKAFRSSQRDAILLLGASRSPRMLDCNDATVKMFGYARREMLGQAMAMLYVNETSLLNLQKQLDTVAGGRSFLHLTELQMKRKDGTCFLAEHSMIPLPATSGSSAGWIGLVRDVAERSRAEEEMKTKDSIMASSISATAMTDLEGHLIYVNPSFVDMWGYETASEVLGKQVAEFWQLGEQAEEVMTELWQYGDWQGELVGSKKDATTFDVQLSAHLIAGEFGEPACMMATFVDISEGKLAAAELRVANERLKKTRCHLSGRVKELNCLYGIARLVVEKFDISLQELLQETVKLIPSAWQYPEIACARIRFADEEFRTANFKATEWRQAADLWAGEHKKGTVEVYYVEERPPVDEGPFLAEERALIKAIAESLGEMIERRQVEQALEESKKSLGRTLAVGQRQAVLILDANEPPRIVDCNRAAVKMFGYTRRVMVGRTIALVHVDQASLREFQNRLNAAVEERGFLHLPEFRMKRKDGTDFPTEHSVVPLKDKGGQRVGWISVVRDTTERKEVQAKRQESYERERELRRELEAERKRTGRTSQTVGV